MRTVTLVALLALAVSTGCVSTFEGSVTVIPELPPARTHDFEKHLLVLRNDAVLVGILADVGGRVVVLRRPEGDNVLKSDPKQWDASTDKRPKPSAAASRVSTGFFLAFISPGNDG